MVVTLFGIASCDSCRKARRWLDDNGISYQYHDLRKDGLERSDLSNWVQKAGTERVLNRRSATWRRVPEVDRILTDDDDAINLMLENPTLIKRPILKASSMLMIGFEEGEYDRVLGKSKA
ncbi:MAG: Spx/MgsR family RNA polymerase-binding regulatory protein [Gammaproteobacteria bacterium]